MIKQMILDAPEMLLMKSGDNPKENIRTAYDLALTSQELPVDHREPPLEMFTRAARFIFDCCSELSIIAGEFYEKAGLVGGATGSASLADIRYLSRENALGLFNITYAQHEAEIFKRDVIRGMLAEFRKKGVA